MLVGPAMAAPLRAPQTQRRGGEHGEGKAAQREQFRVVAVPVEAEPHPSAPARPACRPERAASSEGCRRRTRRGIDARHQVGAEGVISRLREQQVTLTYDRAAGTLHAGATTITVKAS
jgi:hypothetical protein